MKKRSNQADPPTKLTNRLNRITARFVDPNRPAKAAKPATPQPYFSLAGKVVRSGVPDLVSHQRALEEVKELKATIKTMKKIHEEEVLEMRAQTNKFIQTHTAEAIAKITAKFKSKIQSLVTENR